MSDKNWYKLLTADTAARLQEVQDSMAYFSKISISLTDSKITPYTIPSNQQLCSYNDLCKDNCSLMTLRGISEAAKRLEPVVVNCPKGLTLTVVPLGDLHTETRSAPLAYLCIGKVFIGEDRENSKKPVFTLKEYQKITGNVSKVFELIFILISRGNLIPSDLTASGQYLGIKDYTVLTKRELEILKMIGTGLSNRAIARKLYISDSTVKTHITNILDKLEMNNRTELALYAVQALQLNR